MSTFISYSFHDRNEYDNLCYALDRDTIQHWKAADVAAGQSLPGGLRAAIHRCSVCVLIATRNSLDSGWCQAEVGAFWGTHKPVIVYLADGTVKEDDLPKQFRGDKFATTIREVVDALRVHLSELPAGSSAEAMLGLAVEAFADKLALHLKTRSLVGFGSTGGLNPFEPSTGLSANAFGQRVVYDLAKTGADAERELRAIVDQLPALRREKERSRTRTLIDLFAEVQAQAGPIAQHLGMIRLDDASLVGPWYRVQEALPDFWKDLIRGFAWFWPDDLRRLQQFVRGHAAYPSLSADELSAIDTLTVQGELSVDDLVDLTRKHLDGLVKKCCADEGYA